MSAAIDCASHFRFRVHPRQADWYRADKHAFFITAQCVVGLSGIFYNVQLGLGHNNDKGMLIVTKMKEFLEKYGLFWLADLGYSYPRLITPNDERSIEWNHQQKSLCSVVETSIAMVEVFRLASETCNLQPELHGIALMVIYQLTNMNLQRYPLRLGM